MRHSARLVAFGRTEVIGVSRMLNNQKITKQQNCPKNICKFAEFTLRHAVTRLQFQDCNAFENLRDVISQKKNLQDPRAILLVGNKRLQKL